MCVRACGGRRSASDVISQALSTLTFEMRPHWHRLVKDPWGISWQLGLLSVCHSVPFCVGGARTHASMASALPAEPLNLSDFQMRHGERSVKATEAGCRPPPFQIPHS